MEDEKITVPYIVYEGAVARQERTIKRLVTLIVILIFMLFASNAMWLYVWNSYEYVDEEIHDIDLDAGDGNANFIGRNLINGEINNGENQSNNDQTEDQN